MSHSIVRQESVEEMALIVRLIDKLKKADREKLARVCRVLLSEGGETCVASGDSVDFFLTFIARDK